MVGPDLILILIQSWYLAQAVSHKVNLDMAFINKRVGSTLWQSHLAFKGQKVKKNFNCCTLMCPKTNFVTHPHRHSCTITVCNTLVQNQVCSETHGMQAPPRQIKPHACAHCAGTPNFCNINNGCPSTPQSRATLFILIPAYTYSDYAAHISLITSKYQNLQNRTVTAHCTYECHATPQVCLRIGKTLIWRTKQSKHTQYASPPKKRVCYKNYYSIQRNINLNHAHVRNLAVAESNNA